MNSLGTTKMVKDLLGVDANGGKGGGSMKGTVGDKPLGRKPTGSETPQAKKKRDMQVKRFMV